MVAEADIAARVVEWLRAQHWSVYQEVSAGQGYPVADIVAVHGPVSWVIESKRSFGLAVLAQAAWWRDYANLTSVATPPLRRTSAAQYFESKLLTWSGIGRLVVGSSVAVRAAAAFHRPKLADHLRRMLVPQQMVVGVAGSANGGYWTPYQETCRELLRVVRDRPGIRAKDAIDAIRHHYRTDATARSCLLRWARTGKVPGVVVRSEGRAVTLWPDARDLRVRA